MIEEQHQQKSIEKPKDLYLQLFSAAICNLFEDLLEEHDITIPSSDREGEDGEARIYGDVYFDLEAKVTGILAELCEEVKASPDIEINIEDYNGFVEEAVPKNKIMIAVLDEGYYAENKAYPEWFDSDLPYTAFVLDTPEEFIKKWYEIDDGAWYWVFDKGEEICSGAVDPNDIEIFEEHFNMSFETSEMVFEKQILSHLTPKGFDVSQIELEIIDFIDNDHKDCSWYGGTVAEVKYKDYLFSLEARGDIICTLFDKNENELGYVKDHNNGSSFRYEMAHCLANDTELYRAKEDGRLVFENNNWFEIFVRTPDKEWQQATWLTETDDIEDCIFEMIETMDEMIEELTKNKQEKRTVDKVIANAKAQLEKAVENTTVRDVVEGLDGNYNVRIEDINGNVLEAELSNYLTADYLECKVHSVTRDVKQIEGNHLNVTVIKVEPKPNEIIFEDDIVKE